MLTWAVHFWLQRNHIKTGLEDLISVVRSKRENQHFVREQWRGLRRMIVAQCATDPSKFLAKLIVLTGSAVATSLVCSFPINFLHIQTFKKNDPMNFHRFLFVRIFSLSIAKSK